MKKLLLILAILLSHTIAFADTLVIGAGIQSMNGLITPEQTFVNDTNVTVTSTGTTHTLGWSGQLTATRGGTGSQYFTVAGPTQARTYTFPDAATTICGTNAICTGYAPLASPTFTGTVGLPLVSLTDNMTITSGKAIGISSGGAITFTDASPDTIAITNANVGIGTTSPLWLAHLAKAATVTAFGTSYLGIGGAEYSGTNDRYTVGFGYCASSGSKYPAEIGYQTTSGTGHTKGSLIFATRDSTGQTDVPTERMRIDSAGNVGIGMAPTVQFELSGSTGQKASGTTWSNPSDRRIKENIKDYKKGLAEIMQLQIREFDYNGRGGSKKGLHAVGIIAQEIQSIFPDTISATKKKLDQTDNEDTDILSFDMSEVNFALINAIKEQQSQIEELKIELKNRKN